MDTKQKFGHEVRIIADYQPEESERLNPKKVKGYLEGHKTEPRRT
ncbi:hypothetical protein AB6D20_027985 (plasmid) [Vibrio splendidus]